MIILGNKKAHQILADRGLIDVITKEVNNMSNIPFKIESDKVLDVCDLLPTIPAQFYSAVQVAPLGLEDEELLSKISLAAESENEPKLRGLAAIGELLALSAEDVGAETVRNIGWLIESLATQAQVVGTLKENCDYLIKKSKSHMKVEVMS